MIRSLFFSGLVLFLGATCGVALDEKPNIIFILADDLGYGDVFANNPKSKIPTPAMDRIAAEGLRFTDAHSPSSVCTPTRYGILTGRYCWRTRLKKGVLNGFGKALIDPDRITMAEMLRDKGYATSCVGKWHLGIDMVTPEGALLDNEKSFEAYASQISGPDKISIKNGPLKHGFDYSFILPGSLNMSPYAYVEGDRFTELASEDQPRTPHNITIISGGPKAPGFDFEAIVDVFNQKAESFIRSRAKGDKPFFLYFPLTAPHKPVLPTAEFKDKSGYGIYGDFVMQVDEVVAKIDSVLADTNSKENTLVIVTSDNGSFMFRLNEGKPDHISEFTAVGYHPGTHQSNHIWRGTKADIYEGGHRVPLLVRWPDRISPGSTSNHLSCLTDWYATFAELLDHKMMSTEGEDSFSLLPVLDGKADWKRAAPVIHHSVGGMFAIRDENWKLIAGNGSGGRQRPKGENFQKPYQLYDLAVDPSETNDVIGESPEVANRLEAKLEQMRSSGQSR